MAALPPFPIKITFRPSEVWETMRSTAAASPEERSSRRWRPSVTSTLENSLASPSKYSSIASSISRPSITQGVGVSLPPPPARSTHPGRVPRKRPWVLGLLGLLGSLGFSGSLGLPGVGSRVFAVRGFGGCDQGQKLPDVL